MAIDAKAIRELAKGDEAELLAELKAELLPPTIEAIRVALQPRCPMCQKGAQRWAVRNVLELSKLVGAQPQVIMALFQNLGVRDEAEMRHMVESGKRMAQLRDSLESDPAAFLEEGLQLVESVLRMQPDKTPEVLKRLKKLSAATVETNGNGHAG